MLCYVMLCCIILYYIIPSRPRSRKIAREIPQEVAGGDGEAGQRTEEPGWGEINIFTSNYYYQYVFLLVLIIIIITSAISITMSY